MRRDNLLSAIRVVDRIAKAPRFPEDAPACRSFVQNGWTCAGLNAFIWRHPPAFWGLEAERFQTIISAVRYVLRRLNLHADAGWQRNLLVGPWEALHGSLPTEERRRGLILFARYCVLKDISPQAVDNGVLAAFEAWCFSDIVHDDAAGLTRRVASGWNWAVEHVGGWPSTKLQRADMRDEYVLPLETSHPASRRASMISWLRWMAGSLESRRMPPWRSRRHRALPRPAAAPSRCARARSKPSFTAYV